MSRSGGRRGRRPQPARTDPPWTPKRIWRFLIEHWQQVGSAVTAFPVLFYGLGYFAHQSREGLLGFHDTLSYSHLVAVITSVKVLAWLPWDSLLTLFSGHLWLLIGAWGCIVLLLAVPAAERWLSAAYRPTAVGVLLTVTAVLLLFGARFYTAALFPPHLNGVPGPTFDVRPGGNLVESTEFEAVSWLKNDDEVNEGRRQALAGLAGWLLFTAVVAGFRAWKRRDLARRWRQGLIVTYVVLAALIVTLVPRAHAVAHWGLKYPRLTPREAAGCDVKLAQNLGLPGCCLFDVSAGGTPPTVLLWGSGCPNPGFSNWSEDQRNCFVRLDEVIDDDC